MSTATPTPHPTPTGAVHPAGGGTIGHLLDMIPTPWLSGGIVLILLIGLAMELEHKNNKGTRQITRAVAKGMKTKGQQQDEAVGRFLKFVFGSLWRFVTGREMSGKPASNATFLRRGRRPLKQLLKRSPAMAQLGTVAIPEKPLPAVPAGPSTAVQRWRAWTDQQPLPGTLGASVRRVGVGVVWTGGTLHGSLRGISAAGGHTRRTLRAWGTWPYACRALLRLSVLALAWGLWLHAFATDLVLGGVVLAALVTAATGPAGLALWHGVPRGDDEIYGPGLWAALRVALDLKDEEYHDPHLAIPADLSRDDAEITLLLPDHYAGNDTDKQTLDQLVNSRVPGEWVSRFHMMTRPPHVVFTPKPKPKAKPEPPAVVDFFDPRIQAAIRKCPKGYIVLGIDENDQVVVKRLGGDTAHWVASIPSGGGKSTLMMCIIAQLIMQGYTIVIVDVKEASLAVFEGVPGVFIYADAENVQDMRSAIAWAREQVKTRNHITKKAKRSGRVIDWPGLGLIIEEANELAKTSQEWWDEHKPKNARAADPMWGDVSSFMRLARHVSGGSVDVFQDLRDQATGGKGLSNLFGLRMMGGGFTSSQWDRIVGTKPVPELDKKAGRVMIPEGKSNLVLQVPFAEEDAYRRFVLEERQRQGYQFELCGLYSQPPAPTPEATPKLLKGRHVTNLENLNLPPQAVSGAVVAGGGVTPERRDATRDTFVPGQRDGSGEVPSEPQDRPGGLAGGLSEDQARQEVVGLYTDLLGRRRVAGLDAAPASWRGDAVTPQDSQDEDVIDVEHAAELLTMADISRRLEERGVKISDTKMRKDKQRDKESGKGLFPTGTQVPGKSGSKTLYTMAEIVEYYSDEIKKGWGRAAE